MSGKINPGIPIIMAGFGDLLFAVIFWFMFVDGEPVWNYVFAGLVLTGFGTITFGLVNLLRNM